MRSNAVHASLARLALATLLITSGRSECQQPGEEMRGSEPGREDCASVVLLRCAQSQARDSAAEPAPDAREDARRTMQSRRLQQMQAQAGLNAIEITGERPARVQSDAWEDFRRSVSRAAIPDCLSRESFPPEQWGLLRPLVLLGAAATGKCR